ncbi:MAG: GYD domain-containing protein [Chloroflexi bacterium]|nr:MAG: GYD domain-containing protein [Chloroflexota bacterium]
MAAYVALINWTEQGIHDFKSTRDRGEAFRGVLQGMGATLTGLYWTLGAYDIVGIIEAPDDETATAAMLKLGSIGNVRTTTMRAFTADEVAGIIAKAG